VFAYLFALPQMRIYTEKFTTKNTSLQMILTEICFSFKKGIFYGSFIQNSVFSIVRANPSFIPNSRKVRIRLVIGFSLPNVIIYHHENYSLIVAKSVLHNKRQGGKLFYIFTARALRDNSTLTFAFSQR